MEAAPSSTRDNNFFFFAADNVNLRGTDTQLKLPSRREVHIERMMRQVIFELDVVLRITRNCQQKDRRQNRNAEAHGSPSIYMAIRKKVQISSSRHLYAVFAWRNLLTFLPMDELAALATGRSE